MPVPEEKKAAPSWNSIERFQQRREMVTAERERLYPSARIDNLSRAVLDAKEKLNQLIGMNRLNAELTDSQKKTAREHMAVLLYAEIVAREKITNPKEPGYMTKQIEGLTLQQIVERCNSSSTINGILDRELPDFNRETLDAFLMEDLSSKLLDHTIVLAKKHNVLKEQAKAVMAPLQTVEAAANAHQAKMSAVLTGLTDADKDVSMGSGAYDDVIRNMQAFMKLWTMDSAIADPKRWIAACNALDTVADAYLRTKQTPDGMYRQHLSPTTQARVNAVLAVKIMAAEYVHDLNRAREVQAAVLRGEELPQGDAQVPSDNVSAVTGRLPKDTLSYLRTKQELNDIAANLRAANKGVFMGTQIYDDAMKSFEKVSSRWSLQRESEHPERTVKEMRRAAHAIDYYLSTKGDLTKLTGNAKKRAAAMTRARKYLTAKMAQLEKDFDLPKEKVQKKPEAVKAMNQPKNVIG